MTVLEYSNHGLVSHTRESRHKSPYIKESARLLQQDSCPVVREFSSYAFCRGPRFLWWHIKTSSVEQPFAHHSERSIPKPRGVLQESRHQF